MSTWACTETSSAETGSSDHEAGLGRQRPRDADALALAAAEGVREAVHVLGAEADQLQELRHALPARPAVPEAVDQEGLADVVEERHPGVQRAEGVLEDHLDLRAERPQLPPGEPGQVDDGTPSRPEQDLPARRGHRPEDAAGGRRLAAAALADQAQRLALAHRRSSRRRRRGPRRRPVARSPSEPGRTSAGAHLEERPARRPEPRRPRSRRRLPVVVEEAAHALALADGLEGRHPAGRTHLGSRPRSGDGRGSRAGG